MYYLVVTFSITYLKVQVHADTSDILWWLLAAHAVHFLVIPYAGAPLGSVRAQAGVPGRAIGAGAWGFFAFPMMNSGQYLLIMSSNHLGLMIHALMYAPQPA